MTKQHSFHLAILFGLLLAAPVLAFEDTLEILAERPGGEIEVLTLTAADVGLSSDADVPAIELLPDDVIVSDPAKGDGVEPVGGGDRIPLDDEDSSRLENLLGGAGKPNGQSTRRVLDGGASGNPSFDGLSVASDSTNYSRGRGAGPRGRPVYRVIGTAEGLVGHRTATGLIIRAHTEAVALPSRRALERKTRVVYLANRRSTSCPVLDVGPWNTNDPYWERPNGRPQAETGRDRSGRRTNRAGIDIFNGSWYRLLGLRTYDRRLIENTTGTVEWNFED